MGESKIVIRGRQVWPNNPKKPYVKPEATFKKRYTKPEVEVKSKEPRGQERLAQKSDTSSVMTAEQARTVRTMEAKIAKRKTEKGYAIDDNGKIVAETTKSTKNSCAYSLSNLPVGPHVRIHNHPDSEQEILDLYKRYGVNADKSLAGKIGIPLSSADIRNTFRYGNKAVRANTSSGWVFQMETPKENWGKPNSALGKQVEKDWDSHYNSYMDQRSRRKDGSYSRSPREIVEEAQRAKNEVSKKYRMSSPEYKKALQRYLSVVSRINTLAAHTANKSVAAKYGLKYTRKREVRR